MNFFRGALIMQRFFSKSHQKINYHYFLFTHLDYFFLLLLRCFSLHSIPEKMKTIGTNLSYSLANFHRIYLLYLFILKTSNVSVSEIIIYFRS